MATDERPNTGLEPVTAYRSSLDQDGAWTHLPDTISP